MKKVLIILLTSIPLVCLAEWTDPYKIKKLKLQGNGTNVVLDGFTNQSQEVDCGSNGFWLSETEQNYQARTSMLLAAYVSGVEVDISYYECESGLIKIGSVQFEK